MSQDALLGLLANLIATDTSGDLLLIIPYCLQPFLQTFLEMFIVEAPMLSSGEKLTSTLGQEEAFKIRDWLLADLGTEADVLHLNGMPTMLSRMTTAYEFWNVKWHRATVALSRNKKLTIPEFQRNSSQISKTHAICSVHIQIRSVMEYSLLGYHPDGLPKLIPFTARNPSVAVQPVQTFPGCLIQLANIPLDLPHIMETTAFPYAASNDEVIRYHQEYGIRQEMTASRVSPATWTML